jgi:Polysaccharide lyase family 4, domain III/Polysaccharide lyase family 4, domain II/PEP-CTERM motif
MGHGFVIVKSIRRRLLIGMFLLLCPSLSQGQISITQSSGTWTVSNGSLTVVFKPSSNNITSIKVAGHSDNILDPSNSQLYPEFAGTPFGSGTQTSGFQKTSDYIDFYTTTASMGSATNSSGTLINPITYSFHYVMFNDDPAIQTYEVVSHSASDPATSVGQGQFLMRVDPAKFSLLYQVNTAQNNPGATVTQLPNTTATLNELNALYGVGSNTTSNSHLDLNEVLDLNGSPDLSTLIGRNFLNKYDYSSYEQFEQGKTEVGPTYAVSEMVPSHESMTGGPTKQNLQFTNNILMAEFLSGHYGTTGYSYTPTQDIDTSRLFGPFVFRVATSAGKTPAQLYQDAINSVAGYTAKYDEDTTLAANGYVASTARGDLSLSIANPAGWSNDPDNNTIVLSDNSTNFQKSSNGDQYWTQLPSNGVGSITGIVPGTYRMSIYENGQWGETRINNVQVGTNLTSVTKNVQFTPENFGAAAPIFTIGTPDRSSHEFLNGHNTNGTDNRNYYGSYNYWLQEQNLGNPGKVVYYATNVGATPATNDPNKWIANQWGKFDPALYNPTTGTNGLYATTTAGYTASEAPAYVGDPSTYGGLPWEVHFDPTPQQIAQGQYVVLSVGLAAAEASLTVTLNQNPSTTSGNSTHTRVWHSSNASDAMVRSGDAGYYQWIAYQWPTSLLTANADNILYFQVSQNDGDMYDALRMEITNTSADPSVTGWHDYDWITSNGSTNTTLANDALGLDGTKLIVVPEPSSLLLFAGGLLISARRRPR